MERQQYHKTYYKAHRTEQLSEAKKRVRNRTPEEVEARRAYQRAYYAANRERLLEQQRERGRRNYSANPAPYKKRNRRSILNTYGLTEDQYQAMLTAQDGRCLICLRRMSLPAIDHCHTTGVVRGLLCRGCNAALGHFHDDPVVLTRAVEYLSSSSSGAISTPNKTLLSVPSENVD